MVSFLLALDYLSVVHSAVTLCVSSLLLLLLLARHYFQIPKSESAAWSPFAKRQRALPRRLPISRYGIPGETLSANGVIESTFRTTGVPPISRATSVYPLNGSRAATPSRRLLAVHSSRLCAHLSHANFITRHRRRYTTVDYHHRIIEQGSPAGVRPIRGAGTGRPKSNPGVEMRRFTVRVRGTRSKCGPQW